MDTEVEGEEGGEELSRTAALRPLMAWLEEEEEEGEGEEAEI